MTAAILFALYAAAAGLLAPQALRGGWVSRSPRLAISLWLALSSPEHPVRRGEGRRGKEPLTTGRSLVRAQYRPPRNGWLSALCGRAGWPQQPGDVREVGVAVAGGAGLV
jgi:hypothetical protein